MKDVFISYKTEEFDEANWVKTILETNGISCWMAPASIPGGSSYAVEIPQAIRSCKVFVLILSEKSQLSKWVPRELDQAINEEKIILPFMLENCPLKDDFNFYLTNVQRYAAYESKTAAIEKMIKEIKNILGIDDMAENKAEAARENPDKVEKESPKSEVEKEKPQKKKTDKPQNKKSKTKKAKTLSKKGIIIAVVAALVLLGVIIGLSYEKTVEIAGKEISASDEWLYFKEVDFTAADFRKLSELESIKSVELTDCTFPEDAMNDVFTKVQHTLKLDNCGVTDELLKNIDFESMDISTLDLSNNDKLSDISTLSVVADSVSKLVISNCNISDIGVVGEFTKLYSFNASGNKLKDVSVLSQCNSLAYLYLSDNELTSLYTIGADNGLEEVDISRNKFTDLSFFEKCLKLKVIKSADNKLTSLDGISNCVLIREADFSGNLITDASVLAKSAENLVKLNLSNNKLKAIDGLSACVKIRELSLDKNELTSLSALGEFAALEELSASSNKLTDINSLENCIKLREVNLSSNQLVSTQALSAMDATQPLSIDVSDNKLTKLVIPESESIRFLAVYGNPLKELFGEGVYGGSKLVMDYSENVDYAALIENTDFFEYHMFDCPLDKQMNLKEDFGYSLKLTTRDEYLSGK